MSEKKFYSKEFKLKAIALCERSESIRDAAKELGIRPDVLSMWKREYYYHKKEVKIDTDLSEKLINNKINELEELKKELEEVKLERDLLKKVVNKMFNSKDDDIKR